MTDDEIIEVANATETAEPGNHGYILPISFARAIIAQHEAQRQAGQEPVLWRYKDTDTVIGAMRGHHPGEGWTALYTAPQPAQVPLTQIDWQAVGRIMEAHQDVKQRHIPGTTNWGAAIWKAAHGIKSGATHE
jgi:hypothetical protein